MRALAGRVASLLAALLPLAAGADAGVGVVPREADRRVDVFVDGQPFTSYVWPESLTKPVLYPIRTGKGTLVTRGFPLDPRPGERTDHPHHLGLWFSYGDVNGVDFWNNSTALPPERQKEMGRGRHVRVLSAENGQEEGRLRVLVEWVMPDGTVAVDEEATFVFRSRPDGRLVDRITKLTARDKEVRFADNKEGLLGLRVARALEQPSTEAATFTDAQGVALSGKIGAEDVTLVMLDHPENPGAPTYWHARGYGLFAANPLGQKAFSNGKETLDFALAPKASATFRHRLAVLSRPFAAAEVEALLKDFVIVPKP